MQRLESESEQIRSGDDRRDGQSDSLGTVDCSSMQPSEASSSSSDILTPCPLSVSSPLVTLLPELLSDIFLRASASNLPKGFTLSRPSEWSRAVVLSRVCSYWREVALSTPVLWSYFSICTPLKRTLLEELLRRSQGVPLSLRYSVASMEEEEALAILRPALHRIRTLRVSLEPRMGLTPSIWPILRNATALSLLTLSNFEPEEPLDPNAIPDV